MLYGHDRVLAHPLMTEGSPRQSENTSFPLLRNFGDPTARSVRIFGPTPILNTTAGRLRVAHNPLFQEALLCPKGLPLGEAHQAGG
jgi:hypothetical protein